ncbi:MAG TPA: Spy/CpxP family protein refolding chaperone [Vicinamibacterales bacterium]|nr:Spy/CpxP family protein refolding chaperone [Vicinamibacterales bacterium]
MPADIWRIINTLYSSPHAEMTLFVPDPGKRAIPSGRNSAVIVDWSKKNMSRQCLWLLSAVLWLVPAAATGSTQANETPHRQDQRQSREGRPQDQRWKWWINPDDRTELGITDQQSAEIDRIFESTLPELRAKSRELDRLEKALSKTMEGVIDVATLTREVDRVEKLRAEMTTTRTVMLYRIRQVLSPEQRPKMEALRARRAEARRKQADRDKDNRH